MPDFNPNGFLQAYVSDFKVSTQYQQQQQKQQQQQQQQQQQDAHSGTLSSSLSSSKHNNNYNNNKSNKSDNYDSSNTSINYIKMQNTKEIIVSDEIVELTIILVASSADPEVFRELLQGKAIVEYVS